MRTLNSLTGAALLAGVASVAGAASYNVTGTHTYSIGPDSVAPLNASVVLAPSSPTFTSGGNPWQIDMDGWYGNPAVSGSFQMLPYSMAVDFGGPGVNTATLGISSRTLSVLVGGSPYYDEATRTIHVLSPFSQTNPGQTCVEVGGSYCDLFEPTRDSGIVGEILIIFDDESRTSFTGTATVYQLLNTDNLSEASNCILAGWGTCSKSTFVFTGSEVPLPASAWLFGSSVFGLLAAGRRRLRTK